MLSLAKSREVDPKIAAECLGFLLKSAPNLKLSNDVEDVHQLLEQAAVDSIGIDMAGFLNLGKSRNDQVATALRMEARSRVVELAGELIRLQQTLLIIVDRIGKIPFPGYTHMQHAQPITLAHHLFAYFDSFQRDMDRLIQLHERVNLSSMESGALAGTSVAVDRSYVARLLGFTGIVENSIDGVAARDFAIESISDCEMVMLDLSRLAEEVVLWSSKEFGFVEVADEYAATSSIMPQKKNPVVAELVRAKCSTVLGSLAAACSILKALPYSYNLDLQEVNGHLLNSLEQTILSTQMLRRTVSSMTFRQAAIRSSLKQDFSSATVLANYLTKQFGIPFRESHAIVGHLARLSVVREIPLEELAAKRLSSVSRKLSGKTVSLSSGKLTSVLSSASALRSLRTAGSSNPKNIGADRARRGILLRKTRRWVKGKKAASGASDRLLDKESSEFLKEVGN
jgi:argininosuccinate lyase